MIVLAWFILVALIILAGFTMLGATFVHWYRQNKLAKKRADNTARST